MPPALSADITNSPGAILRLEIILTRGGIFDMIKATRVTAGPSDREAFLLALFSRLRFASFPATVIAEAWRMGLNVYKGGTHG